MKQKCSSKTKSAIIKIHTFDEVPLCNLKKPFSQEIQGSQFLFQLNVGNASLHVDKYLGNQVSGMQVKHTGLHVQMVVNIFIKSY